MQKRSRKRVCFVDPFHAPGASTDEFKRQLNRTRDFLPTLSGYIRRDVLEADCDDGSLTIMTIAVWQNRQKHHETKQSMQAEFRRTGFDPDEFHARRNIKLQRKQYQNIDR
jgi:hypothetical protein